MSLCVDCKWLNPSWTHLGKRRNTLLSGIPWRTEQSNNGKYRDVDGLPETSTKGQTLLEISSSCFCFSFWVEYLRLASSTWQETLLSIPPEFYSLQLLHWWWIHLCFLWWKVKNYQRRVWLPQLGDIVHL